MAMLQVLYEVIHSEEFFGFITIPEPMFLLQMQDPNLPILLRCYCDPVSARGWRRNARSQEFFSAVATRISYIGLSGRIMKCCSVAG
jgi:hypothetical protein